MRIRWDNIAGLFLVVFGIYLFIKIRPFLDQWFENLGNDDPFSPVSPTIRMATIGLVCVTIVAVVKILANRKR